MRRFLLLLTGVLFLTPLYLTATGSLTNAVGIWVPRPWPHHLTLDNYAKLAVNPTLKWAGNTLLLAAFVIAVTVVVSMAAGYGFVLRNRQWLFWGYMATMFVPGAALLIPHFLVVKSMALLRTLWAAGAPLLFFPLGIFFARAYMRDIPGSFAESARLDGAGELLILRDIVAPLCVPVAGVIALFKGLQVAQDYLWQAITLQSLEVQTLQVGLMRAVQSGNPGQTPNLLGMQMAVGMILFVPLLALFLVAGRTMMSGLQVGGLRD